MKSDVILYIEKDSSIVASHNSEHFTENALIYADSCENIVITGPGRICGEGNFFSLKPYYQPKTVPFSKTLDVWDLRQEYRKRIRFPHVSSSTDCWEMESWREIRESRAGGSFSDSGEEF